MKKLDIVQMKALARKWGGECLSTIYENCAAALIWECASHLRALRMVSAWPQNVLSLYEKHRN
jgi:hypothetical protein